MPTKSKLGPDAKMLAQEDAGSNLKAEHAFTHMFLETAALVAELAPGTPPHRRAMNLLIDQGDSIIDARISAAAAVATVNSGRVVSRCDVVDPDAENIPELPPTEDVAAAERDLHAACAALRAAVGVRRTEEQARWLAEAHCRRVFFARGPHNKWESARAAA